MHQETRVAADFSRNRYFARGRAAYILGKGKRRQAFLTSSYQVLPAIWDNGARKWEPSPMVDAKTRCLGCHTTLYDASESKYKEMAVGCQSCHGPGHKHLGRRERIVNPAKLSVPRQTMVCGQCHSTGSDPSGKFAFPVSYVLGQELEESFPASKGACPDRNDQYACFSRSKHHSAGVTCITCHDPHGATDETSQLRKSPNRLCIECHAFGGKAAGHLCVQHSKSCTNCHMPGGRHTFAKPGKQ